MSGTSERRVRAPRKTTARREDLFHDWNADSRPAGVPRLVDETLRDGLQSPSAHDPPVEKKIELVRLIAGLGVDCVALGFPAASPRQYDDVLALAREISRARLPLQACCAARTTEQDIRPVVEISQRAGIRMQVGMFIGSSPVRMYTEGWKSDEILVRTENAVRFAREHDLDVLFVTEDTTRATPEALYKLYSTAIRAGAQRVCVADTVGHATPAGASAVVRYVCEVAAACEPSVRVDWHGHRDRGFELANSFAAWQAGADRCHGTALGLGERSGNTPIELLLVNLHLLGWRSFNLALLPAYIREAANALGFAIPPFHPVVGRDAFRTGTGVHAAAVIKARALGDEWLADRVYSSVPAELVDRHQVIDIGPLSGEANVTHWLGEHELPTDDGVVGAVLTAAKRADEVLKEHEILEIVEQYSNIGDSRHASGTHQVRPAAAAAVATKRRS